MQHLYRILIYLILLAVQTACNSSPDIIDRTAIPAVVVETPIEDFQGIQFVDNITSSRALLHWTRHPSAIGYLVKNITSSITYEITRPEQEFYLVQGLQGDVEYNFSIYLVDNEGNLHDNDQQITFTTTSPPSAPTGLSLISPIESVSFDKTPTLRVSGVTPGHQVNIYTDSSCTNLVGSQITLGPSIDITVKKLIPGSYQFYANVIDFNLEPSNCTNQTTSYLLQLCPMGYIEAPANAILGVSQFCVMKYEAKAWQDLNSNNIVNTGEIDSDGCNEPACTTSNWGLGTYSPVSSPQGHPWRKIDLQNSWDQCDSLNSESSRLDIDNDIDNNGTFALISNPEWISISRDVERVNENWTGRSVGSGCLKRGNIGGPASCLGGSSGYDGPNPDSGPARTDSDTASHMLRNGESIWDLSGNVSEWIDWDLTSTIATITPANKAFSSADGTAVAFYRELIDLDINTAQGDQMFSEFFLPKRSLFDNSLFNNSKGTGLYFAGDNISGGAPLRSGAWTDNSNAGIYTLRLNLDIVDDSDDIGFRCVYRPQP